MNILPPDIKLVAIDIDGTLLNPHQRITPRTMAAIQAAREAGIIVTLATGRRYLSAQQFATELALDTPLVLCDGSLVMHHPQKTVLHTTTLQADIAQQAVDVLVGHNIQPVVHRMNGALEEIWSGPAEYDNRWVAAYFAAFTDGPVRQPYATLCAGQPDPLRVVAFGTVEAIFELPEEVSPLPLSWNTLKHGNYGTAEMAMMHTGCSKASGMLALTRHLGISIEEVMAIGDNTNDIEMLQAVGWGVAMGHASDIVKASAHVITASNEEDGVALAIERYVLGRDSNSFKRETCL